MTKELEYIREKLVSSHAVLNLFVETSPHRQAVEELGNLIAYINRQLSAGLDADGERYFTMLWNGYPDQQWDGTNAPHRSKKICKDRFAKCCKKHSVTPEQLVRAISMYVKDCRTKKQWMKGLDTILGTQPVWLDYVEGK